MRSVHSAERGGVRVVLVGPAAIGVRQVPLQSRDGARVAPVAAALELLAYGAVAPVRQHVRALVVRAVCRRPPRAPAGHFLLRRRRCVHVHSLTVTIAAECRFNSRIQYFVRIQVSCRLSEATCGKSLGASPFPQSALYVSVLYDYEYYHLVDWTRNIQY